MICFDYYPYKNDTVWNKDFTQTDPAIDKQKLKSQVGSVELAYETGKKDFILTAFGPKFQFHLLFWDITNIFVFGVPDQVDETLLGKMLIAADIYKDTQWKIPPQFISFGDGRIWKEKEKTRQIGNAATFCIKGFRRPTYLKRIFDDIIIAQNKRRFCFYTLKYTLAKYRLLPYCINDVAGFVSKFPNNDLISQANHKFDTTPEKAFLKKGRKFLNDDESPQQYAHCAYTQPINFTKSKGMYDGKIIAKWGGSGIIEDNNKNLWKFLQRHHKRCFTLLQIGQQIRFTLEINSFKNNKNISVDQGLAHIHVPNQPRNSRNMSGSWRTNPLRIRDSAPIGNINNNNQNDKKEMDDNEDEQKNNPKTIDELQNGLNVCFKQVSIWYDKYDDYQEDSKIAILAMQHNLKKKANKLKDKIIKPEDMTLFGLNKDTSSWIFATMTQLVFNDINIETLDTPPRQHDYIRKYLATKYTQQQLQKERSNLRKHQNELKQKRIAQFDKNSNRKHGKNKNNNKNKNSNKSAGQSYSKIAKKSKSKPKRTRTTETVTSDDLEMIEGDDDIP